MRTRVLLLALLVLVAAAPAEAAKPRLRAFRSCSALIAYGNRHAAAFTPANPIDVLPGRPLPTTNQGADAPAAPVAADGVSGTNNQEVGVDEADTVKTDGRTIWSIGLDGVLHAVDITGATPVLRASLPLGDAGTDHQLLRDGTRLLVISEGFTGGPPTAAIVPVPPLRGATHLTLVDVSDPAHPAVRRTLDADGSVLAARESGGVIRLVLHATPREYVDPQAVSRRHANAWLPAGTYRRTGGTRKRRALIGCRDVRHPTAFSGLETITVLTFDLAKGLDPVDRDGLMSGGETVYASPGNLYVATRRYVSGLETQTAGPIPTAMTTEIHRFTTNGTTTAYAGSGTVPGFLLSQFSMSEAGGVLRVASTDEPPWFAADRRTDSGVTTLKLAAGALTRLGRVDGLGAGERIFAVRFAGDAGYVVTFRQVDPLYTVDLSDPAAPRVAGELPLLGYSAYLHPIGGGRLLGVGRDATQSGQTTGAAVSLFDVSDPAHPRLLARATAPGGFSDVEWDHHAFLWWGTTGLAMLPLTSPDFTGAVGFTVHAGEISELGRITHPDSPFPVPVTRSVVAADHVYTLSERGLASNALATLAPAGFARFP